MTTSTKDTIYIDVDDEITSIIDKVTASPRKIVALVLPKRATVLQSVVNMKLLKRTSDDSKKHVVLVTTEAGLMPLAGAVGLHVAKTPQSKPLIPPGPDMPGQTEPAIDEAEFDDVQEPEVDPYKPVGELAGLPPEEDETIEVDNSSPVNEGALPPTAAAIATKAAKKDKKIKIPNFESFRARLFLGLGALVLLLLIWFVLGSALPKAKISVKTDTEAITTDIDFTANTAAKEFDLEKKVLPATLKEVKKTDTEKVPATGQKDFGTRASGEVTLSLTDCSTDQVTIPAGTGISANNLTFITQEEATLSSVKIGNQCRNDNFKDFSTETVKVVAQNGGDQYNLSPRSYTVAGFTAVSGYGSAMSGGTTKIAKVVSDQDVETAKQKIAARSTGTASDEIKNDLKNEGVYGLAETLNSSQPNVTANPTVGQEANEVTITSITTHSMMGVKEDDLKQLIEADIADDIDPQKQKILSTGLDKASFRALDKKSPTNLRLSMQTIATAGPEIDVDALKREVAGKKRGDTTSTIQNRPGVREVNVEYSPFWVRKTPKKPGKITIVLQKADDSQ